MDVEMCEQERDRQVEEKKGQDEVSERPSNRCGGVCSSHLTTCFNH